MKKFYLLIFSVLFISFANATIPFTVVTNPTTCPNAHNGSIMIYASGGISPYTYSIDGGAFTVSNVFSGLDAGNYDIVVTDATGDTGFQTVTVAQGTGLNLNISTTSVSCSGLSDGALHIDCSNCNSSVTYTIIGGPIIGFPGNNLPEGTYIVEVDDGTCIGTATATIQVAVLIANAGNDSLICAGTNAQLHGSGGTTFLWSPATGLDDPTSANPIATPAATIVYTLTTSLGNTCSEVTDQIVINVANATADAGSDLSICAGSNMQLSGSGGIDFSWSPTTGLSDPNIANPVASPAVTTTYTLTVTNAATCSASDAITITVDNLDIPVIIFNTPVLTVSNPDAGATYTWQQFNGTSWDDIVPAANGTSYTVSSSQEYRVRATKGSCETYSTSLMAGRMAQYNSFGISVYPNPTTDILRLDELKLSDEWETLEIINSQGLRVLPVNNINKQTSISVYLSTLSSGIYIAKLTKADGQTVELRFIKQ